MTQCIIFLTGDKKYKMTVHAEANVALIAGRSARGGTIYVHGAPICADCAGILPPWGQRNMNVAAACRRAGIFQRSLGTDGAKGRGLSPLFRPASGFPSLGASGAIRIHHWVKAELHQDLPVEDR